MDLSTIFQIINFFVDQAEIFLGAGTGEQKRKAVIDTMLKLFELLKFKPPAFITNNIGPIIDALVFFYNLVGAFRKSQPPASTGAPK